MVTKTITITESAYKLLSIRKLENESFSEEITRLLSKNKRKNLIDFLGVLNSSDATEMKKILEKKRKINLELKKKST
jgi:predicted CopG family antitoxin